MGVHNPHKADDCAYVQCSVEMTRQLTKGSGIASIFSPVGRMFIEYICKKSTQNMNHP